jgi:hypothetical protein
MNKMTREQLLSDPMFTIGNLNGLFVALGEAKERKRKLVDTAKMIEASTSLMELVEKDENLAEILNWHLA